MYDFVFMYTHTHTHILPLPVCFALHIMLLAIICEQFKLSKIYISYSLLHSVTSNTVLNKSLCVQYIICPYVCQLFAQAYPV